MRSLWVGGVVAAAMALPAGVSRAQAAKPVAPAPTAAATVPAKPKTLNDFLPGIRMGIYKELKQAEMLGQYEADWRLPPSQSPADKAGKKAYHEQRQQILTSAVETARAELAKKYGTDEATIKAIETEGKRSRWVVPLIANPYKDQPSPGGMDRLSRAISDLKAENEKVAERAADLKKKDAAIAKEAAKRAPLRGMGRGGMTGGFGGYRR
ncbi:MAG: hypothetical protein IRY99_11835 [Isosphaeraceae bacterium]|nr:hypothetical protein [Isosphaeraceae bacterium]